MADVIITVSDPESGICTIFESLQLDPEVENINKTKKTRPPGHKRPNTNTLSNLPQTMVYQVDDHDNDLKSCEYYRHQFMCTQHQEIPLDLNYWINYMAIKKSAGQKVIHKIAAQQKRLEALTADQRKASASRHIILTDDTNEDINLKLLIPPKRKPIKLEPIRISP